MTRVSASFLSIAIFVVIATQALFVAAYIGSEHTIYFWDHAMYFGMARNFYVTIGQGAGWEAFKASLAENYNLLFALPSLITFALFGVSRTVFVLTNFFVFFLAYEAALAFFLRRALGFDWRVSFLLALLASSAIPPLWLPLLEGYPDAGAAGCLALAAGIGIAGTKSWRKAIGVGLALGGAVLLRRHFIYPAAAVGLTLGLLALRDLYQAKDRKQAFLQSAIYFGVVGIACAGFLFLIEPDFIRTALSTDYNALYASYRRATSVFLYFVLGGFGLVLLALAISGLVLLARANAKGQKTALFTALLVVLWLLLWSFGPNQMGHHYILHALPFAASVGLAGWFVILKDKKKYRIGAAAIALFLTINSAWALWFSPHGVPPNDNGVPGVFSAARPPVIRGDLAEWRRLADHLRDSTTPKDRIMVVGSSFVFNQDMFAQLYADDPRTGDMMYRFPKSPEIDHEEAAPLDVFASSTVYVVPSPAQYHLDPSGQKVVTAAANRFPPPENLVAFFKMDDEKFQLDNGVTVTIWRHKPWTPAVLHEIFASIRSDAQADPAFNQDWAVIDMPLRGGTRSNGQGLSGVQGLFDAQHGSMSLMLDQPLNAGDWRLGFVALGDCGLPSFNLAVATADGKIASTKNFEAVTVPGELYQNFTVPRDNTYYLVLHMTLQPQAFCSMQLHNLRVEAQ